MKRWFLSRAMATRLSWGASTWRIEEITQDRVLVSPAPGEPGKMPFWHGDQAGRPLEFGRRIGGLVRSLREMPRSVAVSTLTSEHDLDPQAAENVMRYLADQELASGQVPDDRNIVIERVRDELGRLAHVLPDSLWQQGACALGDGGPPRGFAPMAARTSRRCGARMASCCGFRRQTSRQRLTIC